MKAEETTEVLGLLWKQPQHLSQTKQNSQFSLFSIHLDRETTSLPRT